MHFAPERTLTAYIKAQNLHSYVSADIRAGKADIVLDIEKIKLPANSVDVVLCAHVLEHVDDAKALAELYRILKPHGVLLVMVPIIEGWDKTYENAAVQTSEERQDHFGQWDHVRFYGRDIRKRMSYAGFKVDEVTAEEPFVNTHALLRGEKLFICQKPE